MLVKFYFKDQFLLLTICLLACILLAYRLLSKHINALFWHDHILDPLIPKNLITTLLLISSKLGVYWGKGL